MSVRQIAQLLEENNICTVDELLEAANDSDYFVFILPLTQLQMIKNVTICWKDIYSLDTYDFYTGENPQMP